MTGLILREVIIPKSLSSNIIYRCKDTMDMKTPDILSSENFTSTVNLGELNTSNLFLIEHGPSDAKLAVEIIRVMSVYISFSCILIIKFRNDILKNTKLRHDL